MSMSIAQLEALLDKLEQLIAQIGSRDEPAHAMLSTDDPLVDLADDCDFMLPSPLTLGSLRETAERKINNLHVLLERARQHQEIPSDVQLAADNEDMLIRQSPRP